MFATSRQIAATRDLISHTPDCASSHLSQADELALQAQKELKALIHEMRPESLEGKGLATGIREYADSWARSSEIPARARVQGERETPLEVE